MCLVSKTGTVTSELSCNLTVPLIGWSTLELSVFCVEVSIGLLLLNLKIYQNKDRRCAVQTADKSHHIGVSLPCVLLEDHLMRSEIL
jgi:hypothetical protein